MAAGDFLAAAIAFAAAVSTASGQFDSCTSDVAILLPFPFNASVFTCRPIWNSFILRYSQSQGNILSIVLSAPYTSGWVGMGFSNDGLMVGSSAMVGWIGRAGKAHIRQFYLRGQSSSQVIVNEGRLLRSGVKPAVLLYGSSIYLAFQLKFLAPVAEKKLLFAFSTETPNGFHLTKHDDKVSITFDFSAGSSSGSSYPYKLKRNHGALAIFGWGVLLPIGAIIARYCKEWDLLWFELHLAFQFAGFLFGLAAVVTGISLYNKIHADVRVHRGIGIFLLVLGILQILAFFVRPDKDSKIRRYWNWYHHWVGRLLLFFSAINIILGIKVGEAGTPWKVGYGINLTIILLACIFGEIMLWGRLSKKTIADPPS
ncbi:cytochrome b561 and DOMON domain-containing protein At3g61750 [Dendrobium catenatum]|uniref:Cytochrome b561 and DOMON domain-containing protein n=1 Tax=Dendrobium catenatum TaxID=906689 RepID=A0A2I0W195_9ASPA|nr:cytochrome b561 and DOMON domain-containing protein At3g61750 [Dendrobium catenatum]PKU69443.1 hypothetical protein MA16_Dca018301 [Dendrobium catenatum]